MPRHHTPKRSTERTVALWAGWGLAAAATIALIAGHWPTTLFIAALFAIYGALVSVRPSAPVNLAKTVPPKTTPLSPRMTRLLTTKSGAALIIGVLFVLMLAVGTLAA